MMCDFETFKDYEKIREGKESWVFLSVLVVCISYRTPPPLWQKNCFLFKGEYNTYLLAG